MDTWRETVINRSYFQPFVQIAVLEKKARFFSYSWVHGQRIGKGDGYLYLLDSRNLVLKDNSNRTYNLFKTVSEK